MLVRVYEWDLPTAGRIYGTVALIAGSSGVFVGPVLGKWLSKRGYTDYPLRVSAIGAAGVGIFMGLLPFQTGAWGAIVCVGFAGAFVTLPLALVTFVIQTVSPANMRGVVSGIYVATCNPVGLALGPTLVAVTTDYVFQDPMKVHLSLAMVSVAMSPPAFILLARGMKQLGQWHGQNA